MDETKDSALDNSDDQNDDLIRSNFIESDDVLNCNENENPLIKKCTRILNLKTLTTSWTQSVGQKLVKREEQKIVNRLQKENEIRNLKDFSDEIQKGNKVRFDYSGLRIFKLIDDCVARGKGRITYDSGDDSISDESDDEESEYDDLPDTSKTHDDLIAKKFDSEVNAVEQEQSDHENESEVHVKCDVKVEPSPAQSLLETKPWNPVIPVGIILRPEELNHESDCKVPKSLPNVFSETVKSSYPSVDVDFASTEKLSIIEDHQANKAVIKRPFLRKGSGLSRFFGSKSSTDVKTSKPTGNNMTNPQSVRGKISLTPSEEQIAAGKRYGSPLLPIVSGKVGKDIKISGQYSARFSAPILKSSSSSSFSTVISQAKPGPGRATSEVQMQTNSLTTSKFATTNVRKPILKKSTSRSHTLGQFQNKSEQRISFEPVTTKSSGPNVAAPVRSHSDLSDASVRSFSSRLFTDTLSPERFTSKQRNTAQIQTYPEDSSSKSNGPVSGISATPSYEKLTGDESSKSSLTSIPSSRFRDSSSESCFPTTTASSGRSTSSVSTDVSRTDSGICMPASSSSGILSNKYSSDSIVPNDTASENESKYSECSSSQVSRASSVTASMESLSDSGAEEDTELELFEIMEVMTERPSFTEFSSLAKKFVNQENVNEELSDELKRNYIELATEKDDLQMVNEELMKEKAQLLKNIEDLLYDKDALSKDNKILQKKASLELNIEKQAWEKEKRGLLHEKELLAKNYNILISDKILLVSQKKSLMKENSRLLKDNQSLLKEKGEWLTERSRLSAEHQHLLIEKETLFEEREMLIEEKDKLMEKLVAAQDIIKTQSTIRLPDGGTIITLDNGTKKYTDADGRDFKFEYHNGDIKETLPDGTINYFYAETNLLHITQPDGTIVMKFDDGQIETLTTDGSRKIEYTNKLIRTIKANGSEEYIYPDSTVAKNENGTRTFTFPNGQKEVHHEHYIQRIFPDGTVKTLFKDGSTETTFISGRIRAKDRKGRLIYDNGASEDFLRENPKYT